MPPCILGWVLWVQLKVNYEFDPRVDRLFVFHRIYMVFFYGILVLSFFPSFFSSWGLPASKIVFSTELQLLYQIVVIIVTDDSYKEVPE